MAVGTKRTTQAPPSTPHPSRPAVQVWLVDVLALGPAAFEQRAPGPSPVSLRSALEDPALPKLLFDGRMDAAALDRSGRVALRGLVDLQLADVAARQARGGRGVVARAGGKGWGKGGWRGGDARG